jgi:hypothetical protein
MLSERSHGGSTMRVLNPLVFPIALVLLLPVSAAAESKPCSAEEHRQFDFWIGEWEVRAPDGTLAGTNSITRIQGGCALLESWQGKSGLTGTSLNVYDSVRGRWHQTWVDSRGSVLQLEGGRTGAKMILAGATRSPGGETVTERITWERTDGGAVRQLWEQSSDGGKSWTVAFEGRYTRRR